MSAENTSQVPEKKTPWYLSRPAVIWGLLLIGPFAMPFLWLSPNFKLWVKAVVTLAAIALTYASYIFMPILIDRIMNGGPDIGSFSV